MFSPFLRTFRSYFLLYSFFSWNFSSFSLLFLIFPFFSDFFFVLPAFLSQYPGVSSTISNLLLQGGTEERNSVPLCNESRCYSSKIAFTSCFFLQFHAFSLPLQQLASNATCIRRAADSHFSRSKNAKLPIVHRICACAGKNRALCGAKRRGRRHQISMVRAVLVGRTIF